jgi:hypothetical protein
MKPEDNSSGFFITFGYMKFIFSTLFFLCILGLNAQSTKLKKKWLKTYVGSIPSYEININNNLYQIDETKIEIQLTKDSLYILVGPGKWIGTYSVIKTEKKKYEIQGKMEGSGVAEILYFDAREKKITRKGLFPQPNANLTILRN